MASCMATCPNGRVQSTAPPTFCGLRGCAAGSSNSARLVALRPVSRRRAASLTTALAATEPKKILMLGGTRFIGVYLARQLVEQGHDVTLLTRGKSPVTQQIPDDTADSFAKYEAAIKHIACDRKDADAVKEKLSGAGFQGASGKMANLNGIIISACRPDIPIYDMNGREADEAQIMLDAAPGIEQYIFCSSAGVYLKSDQMPHREEDAVDPKSRHKGKLNTEDLLDASGVNWTSIRPVYIYGPLNYNPVEEWFFQRVAEGRPIPVPNSGLQVTQLGHVKDLATAFVKVLSNQKASREVFNISGERFVTFDGIAKACAEAAGAPEPELIHYNPKDFDFGKSKAFPMRDQHFFASNDKAMTQLDWKPEFGLVDGLRDSYQKDFGLGNFRKAADFTTDDMVLEKVKGKVPVMA